MHLQDPKELFRSYSGPDYRRSAAPFFKLGKQMRIISNFADYYDFPQKYGFDPKIQYLRKSKYLEFKTGCSKFTKEENKTPTKKPHSCYGLSKTYFHDPRKVTIGFCEKLYDLFMYNYNNSTYIFKSKQEAIQWASDFVGAKREKIKNRYYTRELEPYWETPVNQMLQRYPRVFGSHKVTLQRYKKAFNEAPLFIHYSINSIQTNFCFRSWGLQSFMEATQLYQELSQYMSNIWAINQPPIPIPSDKDMVSIKGFDKYSFRKDKK